MTITAEPEAGPAGAGASPAEGRALIEFDRALLYLLVFILFGLGARRPSALRWIVRSLAAAMFVVCACALTTRLLPHVWPTGANVANNRLSFPLGYWNA